MHLRLFFSLIEIISLSSVSHVKLLHRARTFSHLDWHVYMHTQSSIQFLSAVHVQLLGLLQAWQQHQLQHCAPTGRRYRQLTTFRWVECCAGDVPWSLEAGGAQGGLGTILWRQQRSGRTSRPLQSARGPCSADVTHTPANSCSLVIYTLSLVF